MPRRGGESSTMALAWPWSPGRPRQRASADGLLLAVVLILAVFGLVMVFSASAVLADSRFQDSFFFLKRQMAWLGVGFLLMQLASRTDYEVWRKLAWPLLGLTVVMLVLVLVPSIGAMVKGARRWLRMGPISVQPAEVAKLAIVIFLATYLARKEGKLGRFWPGLLPALLVVGLVGSLILRQPDLGTVVILGLLTYLMLYLGGARLTHLLTLLVIALPLAATAVWASEYRRQRLLTFLAPWNDPLDAGFQVTQSFLAFGSGGAFGVGLGEGKQKLFFLPEAHTDFVLALVGEELGLIGTTAIMALFAVLVVRGFRIAERARSPFGRHLAHGITLLIGVQALINAGVATGLLPTKGMTLPLISYGGSSLVVTMVGIGILLSISRDRRAGREHGGYGLFA